MSTFYIFPTAEKKRAELNLMYFILTFKMEMLCQAEVD